MVNYGSNGPINLGSNPLSIIFSCFNFFLFFSFSSVFFFSYRPNPNPRNLEIGSRISIPNFWLVFARVFRILFFSFFSLGNFFGSNLQKYYKIWLDCLNTWIFFWEWGQFVFSNQIYKFRLHKLLEFSRSCFKKLQRSVRSPPTDDVYGRSKRGEEDDVEKRREKEKKTSKGDNGDSNWCLLD